MVLKSRFLKVYAGCCVENFVLVLLVLCVVLLPQIEEHPHSVLLYQPSQTIFYANIKAFVKQPTVDESVTISLQTRLFRGCQMLAMF